MLLQFQPFCRLNSDYECGISLKHVQPEIISNIEITRCCMTLKQKSFKFSTAWNFPFHQFKFLSSQRTVDPMVHRLRRWPNIRSASRVGWYHGCTFPTGHTVLFAMLNQRQWRWFNVATTSCAQWVHCLNMNSPCLSVLCGIISLGGPFPASLNTITLNLYISSGYRPMTSPWSAWPLTVLRSAMSSVSQHSRQ